MFFPSLSRVLHLSDYDPNSIQKHFRTILLFTEHFLKWVAKKHYITQHTVSLSKTPLPVFVSRSPDHPGYLLIFPPLSMGSQSQRLTVKAVPFQSSPSPLHLHIPPQVSQAFLMYGDLPSVLYFSTHHLTPPVQQMNVIFVRHTSLRTWSRGNW